MTTKPRRRRAALVIAVLSGIGALARAGEEAATAPDQAIARGRQIYLTGVPGDASPLVASVGDPPMEMPASILRCVNCHGRDGRGQTEGGVTPANIRWEELNKSYRRSASGRQRTAYSDKLLVRAIATGRDASGNQLDPAMPRYRLSHQQAADLLAYLHVLGREPDPGVGEDSLKIGVVLPPASLSGSARSIREILTAFALQANEQGGVYGRQLKVAFITSPDEVEARAGAIRDFVETEQPFALISSYLIGCEEEIGRYLEENKVPLIGPIALYAKDEPSRHRFVFHLVAGLAGQGEALGRFATQLPQLVRSAALLVRPEGDEALRAVTETISNHLVAAGWDAPCEVVLAETSKPDWTALLAGGRVTAVFWFAPSIGLDQFYHAAATSGFYPFLFAPGVLAGPESLSAPADFAERIFFSFPSLPSDQTSAGKSELSKLANEAHVSDGSFPRLALASAKLLLHGLRQEGKEVTREKLVGILENLYGYSTEQTPAVTFSQNRGVGAGGAYVVGIDLQRKSLSPASKWVPLH